MKKNFFSAAWLIAGAAVMFSSCSNDEDVINGGNGNGNEPVQVISMQVANTGDNFIGTRAADRPLYSSEANQSIENVKVVLYKLTGNPDDAFDSKAVTDVMYGAGKDIVAQKTFTPWMNGGVSSTYSDATKGHGRQASWTLATADLIKEEGVYMAYAVGYNTNNYKAVEDFDALVKGTATLTTPLNVEVKDEVKEIFAGSALFKVTKQALAEGDKDDSYHFNVSLTLHRQIAGSIGYFTNIPTKGNADNADKVGAKLRLVASAKNTKAVFAGFNSAYTGTDEDGIGKPAADATVKYVVNGHSVAVADAKFYGSGENDAFNVYEVELKKWFTGKETDNTTPKMDTNADGLLNELDTWTNAITAVNVKTGSVLGSSFMIPFELVADKATFQLQMLDADGGIIRYWNIRLPKTGTTTDDSQIGKNVTIVAEGGGEKTSSNTESNINYSIVRNHLYTIGARDMGDNPTDPGTDPDKPQDLNDETLILRVNDNWEMIHHMEVD